MWRTGFRYDPMHVMDGIIKHAVLATLQNGRYTPKVRAREQQLRRYSSPPVPVENVKQVKDVFHSALTDIRTSIPSAPGVYRLKEVLDTTTKVKTHTRFDLAGPYGLYALKRVEHLIPAVVYQTLNRVLVVCGLLWSKELDKASLPRLEALTATAVCMVEAFLPKSERDVKLHEFFHLPSNIRDFGEQTALSCSFVVSQCSFGVFYALRVLQHICGPSLQVRCTCMLCLDQRASGSSR